MAPSETAVRRLSRRGRILRVVSTLGVLTALAVGTSVGSNKLFPAGPMTQYAFYIAPDGLVISNVMYADTTAGTRVHVLLTPHNLGVKRADIEAQLDRIVADPSLLRTVSTAQRRLHPHEPQYTKLYIIQHITQLKDRVPARTYDKVLVSWTVTP